MTTNVTSYSFGLQADIDTDPTAWKQLEPNTIGTLGANISTIARSPISKNRQRKKGTIVDLDSAVSIECDVTYDFLSDFSGPFAYANHANAGIIHHVRSGALWQDLRAVNATSSFDHDAIANAIPAGTLVKTRGWMVSGNNDLWEVDASSTTTSTIVTVAPTDETPGNTVNAQLEVAGFRGATGDLTWTDATLTLGSTALDFTTLGLMAGQFIHIGGLTTTNQFADGVAYGRIVSISATAIVIDKATGSLIDQGTDDPGTGKRIDILYGRFYRNVASDDASYVERILTVEATWPDLIEPGPADGYEYALDNYPNSLVMNFPLTQKVTATANFVGTDTAVPTSSRKTNASTPARPVGTTAFNTVSDYARLRITEVDETGLTTYFKAITLTINNNVSPEKVQQVLGAAFVNVGNLEISGETQVLFTSADVVSAIRNNTTVTMEIVMKNDDGAFAIDLPSMTLGGGGKDLPVGETVLLNITGQPFEDATLGTSFSISLFPAIPL